MSYEYARNSTLWVWVENLISIVFYARESRRMKRYDEECPQTLFQEYLKTAVISSLVSHDFFWAIISASILLAVYSLAWIVLRELIQIGRHDISKNLGQPETNWRSQKQKNLSTAVCQHHAVHTFSREISLPRLEQNFFSLVAAFFTNTVRPISCLILIITYLTTWSLLFFSFSPRPWEIINQSPEARQLMKIAVNPSFQLSSWKSHTIFHILAEFLDSFIDPSSLSTNPWFLPGNNLMEQQNVWNLRKFNLNHYSIKILSLQDFFNSKSSMSDHSAFCILRYWTNGKNDRWQWLSDNWNHVHLASPCTSDSATVPSILSLSLAAE
jgi:hypothetical protein